MQRAIISKRNFERLTLNINAVLAKILRIKLNKDKINKIERINCGFIVRID